MIYVHEIQVADKEVWGGVWAEEFALPAVIKKIRGVMANVLVGSTVYPKRLIVDTSYYVDEDGNIADPDNPPVIYGNDGEVVGTQEITKVEQSEVGGFISVQIGSVSLSLNDDKPIMSAFPANMISELRKTSYSNNMRVLGEKLTVEEGSMMRVTMEEKLLCPFIGISDLSNDTEKAAYGYPAVATKDYTLKIYVDYE